MRGILLAIRPSTHPAYVDKLCCCCSSVQGPPGIVLRNGRRWRELYKVKLGRFQFTKGIQLYLKWWLTVGHQTAGNRHDMMPQPLSLPRVINFKFPAASLEKLHHTAWRTWLFTAHYDERYYTTNSDYLTYTFLFGWENELFELGSESVVYFRISPVVYSAL